ncbi:MAG: hypothetical protein WBD13_06700 [Burkholderiaceae bacterium]
MSNVSSRPPRTIVVTACSALFYDSYIDLINSMEAVGISSQYDLGVIDLGLTDENISRLAERGVRRVAGDWPVTPPPGQDRPEFVAFAGKPFVRDYFPGYEVYVWMDADMWVQTPRFWHELIDGALHQGCAVSEEKHPAYRPMPFKERFWMLRHLSRAFGPTSALKIATYPMVNNGSFSMHADAPHWQPWQERFKTLVDRTQRMIAIDQLAMFAMIHLDKPGTVLSSALNNWVCSLGTPHWDPARGQFVAPDSESEAISVLHVTTPARARVFEVPTVGAEPTDHYLHRPDGKVVATLPTQPKRSIGAVVS